MSGLALGSDVMSRRDASVETLRGLAVVLMVAGHVIGTTGKMGMEVGDHSGWRYFYHATAPYRMPLFTAISGFVYALRPLEASSLGGFTFGKLRRLVLPLVFVGSIQFLIGVAMGRSLPYRPADMWMIYCYPFEQFWFLQALLLVFLCVAAAEVLGWLACEWGWAFCLITSSAACVLGPSYDFFSCKGALYLLPFFLLGVGLQRFRVLFQGSLATVLLGGSFGVTLVLHQCQWFGLWTPDSPREGFLLQVIAGISGCWLLFRWRRPAKGLAWLGPWSYSIYLWHILGSTVALAFAKLLGGPAPEWVVFTVGMTAGLGVPIGIELSLRRFPLASSTLLGQRGGRSRRPGPEVQARTGLPLGGQAATR